MPVLFSNQYKVTVVNKSVETVSETCNNFLNLWHAEKYTGASIPRVGSPRMSPAPRSRGCDTSLFHLFQHLLEVGGLHGITLPLSLQNEPLHRRGRFYLQQESSMILSDKNVKHKKRNVIPTWTNTNTLLTAVSSCHHELLVTKGRALNSLCLVCNSDHW